MKPHRESRRMFLQWMTSLSATTLIAQSLPGSESTKLTEMPFTLGVASGDPDSSSVVLWTRLSPRPMEPGGGMPAVPVSVEWEIADNDQMRQPIATGTVAAMPSLGHSVHVVADGLEPDRWYFYRFRCGDFESAVGRTRTMPETSVMPDRLRFAFASCQNYEQGLFTAYEQICEDDLDVLFFLGDYIYEYASGRNGSVRTHFGGEIESLEDYRIRYAQYRLDPLLQSAHASCPWFLTWDDHEFDNNCAGDISEESGIETMSYLARRANAYQAYYEMMPLRPSCIPKGWDMQLYRTGAFGQLAEFFILDTRQFRSDQPNGDRRSPLNDAAMNPSQTIMGHEQSNWLSKQLITSRARWNVLAQQVMMGMVDRKGDPDAPEYSMDQWPGYAAERMRLVKFMADRKISNPVVLTGDIHSNWANELRVNDLHPDSPVVATEFVTTSISSGGNGTANPNGLDGLLAANPCVRFHNAERGYVRCEVTPEQWQADYVVVDDVLETGGSSSVRRSFVVESGDPRLQDA